MNRRPPVLSDFLSNVSDDELQSRRQGLPARLAAFESAEAVDAFVVSDVLPLEREGVWRGRMPAVDLAIVTVGNQPDTPTMACLGIPARFVALVHTAETRNYAEETARRMGFGPGDAQLVGIGDGLDAERTYREIRRVWEDRSRPGNVVVDPTGGFKSMTAAASAVAFTLPGCRASYVETDQPKFQKRTVWLRTRIITLANPHVVFGDIDRETGRRLLADGRYSAAKKTYDDLASRTGDRADEWRAALAGALERAEALDFATSATAFGKLAEWIERDVRLERRLADDALAGDAFRAALRLRAEGQRRVAVVAAAADAGRRDPNQDSDVLRSPEFLDFVEYLLTLAARKLQVGEYDLAALYAYRAMEALPQRRLALRGFDVSKFDWEKLCADSGVTTAQARLALMRRIDPREDSRAGSATAVSRAMAYAILAHAFPGDLVEPSKLKQVEGIGDARNRSILAHGVCQIGESNTAKLLKETRELFERLLVLEDVGGSEREALRARHAQLEIS